MMNTKLKKNIIIVSQSSDYATKYVLDWLISKNIDFVYIDSNKDHVEIEQIIFRKKNPEFSIKVNGKRMFRNPKNVTFFRKGLLKLNDLSLIEVNRNKLTDVYSNLGNFIFAYESTKIELMNLFFNNENTIGFNNGSRINKVTVLFKAKEFNLSIPETIITTSKNELTKFLKKNGEIITKSLDINTSFIDEDEMQLYRTLTTEINFDNVTSLSSSFPLTMFQRKIRKNFELRIFFIDNTFYTAAILSQYSDNTKVDYRNYDDENMNRVVPYKLPLSITNKLKKLLHELNLKTASVDMIVNDEGHYIFLEVNPNGQYMAVSNWCNFYLKKKKLRNIYRNKFLI